MYAFYLFRVHEKLNVHLSGELDMLDTKASLIQVKYQGVQDSGWNAVIK